MPLARHVLLCVTLVAHYAFAGEAEWQVHMNAATLAHQRGDYIGAGASYNAALKEAQSFGEADQRLATTLNYLAGLYIEQGRYAEAEPLFTQSLVNREKALGPNHLEVGLALSNLGRLYLTQRRYAEAEPPLRRSLSIVERTPDHPAVGTVLSNLARVYLEQARYAEAEPLFRRSLVIREKALGPDHPDVGSVLGNLARLYHSQRRYAEAEPLYRRSLVIREKALGVDHPAVGSELGNLARLYHSQRRYVEAVPLLRRALSIVERNLGPEHLAVGTEMLYLAKVYYEHGRYTEAEPLFQRSLVIREKSLGLDHPEVGTSLYYLARLYLTQGRYAEAESILRRSLSIYEKAFGQDHQNLGAVLGTLASVYYEQGRYAEAEPLFRRSLVIREKTFGPEHSDVGSVLGNLAQLYHSQGRNAEAEPLLRRSLSIVEKTLGPNHPDLGSALDKLAWQYLNQGRYAEAEPLYRRTLVINEKAFGLDHSAVGTALHALAQLYVAQGRYAEGEPLLRRALSINEKAIGPDHQNTGAVLGTLARLYEAQGRYAEAEPLLRRSLSIYEKALGPNHAKVGIALNQLARLFNTQGDYANAVSFLRRSLGIYEKALGPDHPNVAMEFNNLGLMYLSQGRPAEAEPLLRRSLSSVEKTLGPDHPAVGSVLGNLARQNQAQGRYADAESLYLRTLSIEERALGPDHPSVGATLGRLAHLYGQQDRLSEGLRLVRRATQSSVARYAVRNEGDRSAVLAEQRTKSSNFELHVALLHRAHGSEPNAAAEGFEVAQLARASDTAEQVANMAARYAAGSDALAQLARAKQDAIAQLQSIDAHIVKASSRATTDRNAAAETRLREEAVETTKAIAALDARLEREYPQYRELTDPKPMTMAETAKLLAADEALATFLVLPNESFLWITRRNNSGIYRLAIGREELSKNVRMLRRQLDLGIGDPDRMLARPFNVAAAHALYQKLFAEAEASLVGVTNLIVVSDGALASLPLGVLVTDLPSTPVKEIGEHAGVAWLAKKYAITVLPAVSSLRALRQFAKPSTAREPFGGFGDPLLEGGNDARRAMFASLYARGMVADVRDVRKLARLPESADELRAIGGALKAAPDAIRLGAAATERAVKQTDLTRYRNLAFATHGLMAGQFRGLGEPALVLTPPAQGSELDDGLLTASEISQLKLDADWVVLSACNTAAPDGTPGAEGLSGLARAFFYAGARSLLVSHWSVNSEATVALTTRMFEESAKGVPKAEALRLSMLALMQTLGEPHFAHPALWAPFVVVGEGGERNVSAR